MSIWKWVDENKYKRMSIREWVYENVYKKMSTWKRL